MNAEETLRLLFRRILHTEVGYDAAVEEVENWDSLSHIRLIMEIERAFGIEIPSNHILSLYTRFSDILHYLDDGKED